MAVIAVTKERRPGETRVAATPETVKKLTQGGHHTVLVQTGAGVGAAIPDAEFTAAGASIAPDAATVYAQSDILFKIRGPEASELALLRPGVMVVGSLSPYDTAGLDALAATVQAEGLQSPSIIVVGDVVQGARAWAAQTKTSHKTA